uniref:Transposase (Putative), gypsy type n=1 Tax=Tanacetum cinerariifolium TaxID=118510 RepID=A0A6L2NAR7_TANCI|nr:transposase (putative), gypsy type [Tanacetum cinerariifolium]
MSFSKRPDSDAVCYTKPLDSLKHWNDRLFWVNSFACPASFPWHVDKNVSKDPFPKSTEFNAYHYAILVAHPDPFRKYPEPFLCLVGMSCYYTLDEETYPRFFHNDGAGGCLSLCIIYHVVKIIKRERVEEEAKLMDSTIGRMIPLLPVAPARAESELEASVEKLFDEGGNAKQRDFAAGGGHDAEIELVTAVEDTAARNVTVERHKRPHKKRPGATDASASSHPPKKLRGDYGTSSEVVIGGKSPSAMKELLASGILSVEAGVSAMPTFPFVTSSVSAMPEREGDALLDSATGGNLRTIGTAVRSIVPPPVTIEVVITTSVSNVPPVLARRCGSFPSSWERALHGISADTSREFIDHLAPSVLFAQIRDMDYEELFTKFSVRTARQACLSAESMDKEIENPRAQLLLKEAEAAEAALLRKNVAFEDEQNSLNGKIIELQSLIFAKDLELKDLNVHALGTTCFGLREQVSGYDHLKEQIEEFQDAQMKIVDDKVAKLDVNLFEDGLSFRGEVLPSSFDHYIWLEKYLTALGTAISCAIEKGIKSGLAARIDHGKEGRSLTDVAAYNPNAEADFNSALQKLREVDFPLVAELKSHKDASVEDIMNLLCLEGPLADAPGLTDLQPNVEQLRVPIHRENIATERSALMGVWIPLSEPLSVQNLTSAASTSGSVPATVATTTALSTTFASASFIPPIIVDDYEVVNADGQENSQGNVASFSTVDFEKEELDTTLKRGLLN